MVITHDRLGRPVEGACLDAQGQPLLPQRSERENSQRKGKQKKLLVIFFIRHIGIVTNKFSY